MQPRPASPAVARFLARTAADFTAPAPLTPAERRREAGRSIGRMLLAMAAVLALAFALARAERQAPSSTAPVPIGHLPAKCPHFGGHEE